jgi:hypothetical protein
MTGQNYDDAIAELGRTRGMDSQAAAALERRLLQAFSDHHSARVAAGTEDVRSTSLEPVSKPKVSHAWRRWSAAAAVLVLYVGGMAGWRALRGTSPVREARQATTAPALPPVAHVATNAQPAPAAPAVPPERAPRPRPRQQAARPAPFVALPGAAGLPEFESGTIVRLELSLASLPSYGVDITRAGTDRPVEADVLVGQDGQPRAIRLVTSGNARTLRSQQ